MIQEMLLKNRRFEYNCSQEIEDSIITVKGIEDQLEILLI